jgi:hypothetical protein
MYKHICIYIYNIFKLSRRMDNKNEENDKKFIDVLISSFFVHEQWSKIIYIYKLITIL